MHLAGIRKVHFEFHIVYFTHLCYNRCERRVVLTSRSIGFQDLINDGYNICCLSGLRQNWHNGSRYSYLSSCRSDNGLTLILCRAAEYTFPCGKKTEACRGDVMLIPAGSRYCVEFFLDENDISPASLLINFTVRDIYGEMLSVGDSLCRIASDHGNELRDRFLSAIDEYGRGRTLVFKAKLLELISIMNESQSPRAGDLSAVTGYIDGKFGNVGSVGELAEIFSIGESTLRRRFGDELGVSPGEYIAARKTERIKELLAVGEITTDDICEQLGFFDVAHLCKFFRKHTGMTMREWQKRSRRY